MTTSFCPAGGRIEVEMTRLLCLEAADMVDRAGNKTAENGIAMIKVQAPQMALRIIEDGPYTRTIREWDIEAGDWVENQLIDEPFKPGDRVIAFVNSMGGTPVSELYAVYRKLAQVCETRGLTIVRNLIGPYITSLEMQGCSITLLKADDEILKF